MNGRKGSLIAAGIVGGLASSVVTGLLLLFAAPDRLAGRIVRQGMLSDPQILVDTADALRDRQYAPILAQYRKALETPFGSSWKGAEKPEVVLVEFFDYACAYCRASLPHVEQLLKEDKGLRVVFRELPILGQDSVAAARVSLAASKTGHFNQYHDALYAAGRPAPQTIAAAAQAAGIVPSLDADPQVEGELKQNLQIAGQLGATGTPMWVIGDRVLSGAVGYEVLKKAIADARSRKPAASS